MHILWLYGTDNFIQAKHSINVVKYSLFPLLFLSFLDKKFAKYVITGFIAGILLSEFFSYALQFGLLPWELNLYTIPIYKVDIIGDPSPFLNHSYYATSLAFVFILLLYSLLTTKATLLQKLFSLFFMLSISINLSLVGGRIGYVLYITLILFLIFYLYKKQFVKPFLIVLILFGSFFTLAYNTSPLFQDRINQTTQTLKSFQKGDIDFTTSIGQRVGFWYYSLPVILNNPVLGVGTGDYMDAVKKTIPNNQNNMYVQELEHPHNMYIQLLLQFGIVGIIVFFYLIYKLIRYPSNDEYMKFVKYSITITILIAILTETFIYRYYLPIFIIMISATIASKEFFKSDQITYSKKTYLIYALLLLAATVNAKLHFIISALKSLI